MISFQSISSIYNISFCFQFASFLKSEVKAITGAVGTTTISQSIDEITCIVTSSGRELSLPAVGVSLDIPAGAIAKDDVIEVSISLPVVERFSACPPLQDDHTLICPIVRCKPESVMLLKPATLTLPSCAVNGGELNVTMWKKPSSGMSVCLTLYLNR